MRKLTIILIILFLASCAGRQQAPYVIPDNIKQRPAVSIYHKVGDCLRIADDGISSKLFINPSKEPNGWIDKNNDIYLTEGLFKYDDETITFVIAHEFSHAKLKHVRNRQIVSHATTGVMMVVNAIVPGAGWLNYAVNPAVTNNFSKSQEYDADKLASETLIKCFNISVEKQIHILESLQKDSVEGGGFWAMHPSWNDRIENIKSQNLNK